MPPEAFDISYKPTKASDIYRYRKSTDPDLDVAVYDEYARDVI